VTAPILSAAGLLQVAPAATYVGLGGATLLRLMPSDAGLARGIADWLVQQARVHELLVVHDHDRGYGVPVGRMCAEAASRRGIETRCRPVWNQQEAIASDLAGVEAVLYVGVPGPGTSAFWRDLHAVDPDMWLLATDGLAVDWLARAIDEDAARRTRFFTAQRAPWGFYGYEAMALILDAVAESSGSRGEAVRAARSTRDRDSCLGRYSIDAEGLTTARASGRLAISGGELVWERAGLPG
jgi:branched-chain amino acid transport system substrate-binding protein